MQDSDTRRIIVGFISPLKYYKLMILGVCEWLSLKLGWDVSMIHIAVVVRVLIFGAGLGLYLILWVVKMFSE